MNLEFFLLLIIVFDQVNIFEGNQLNLLGIECTYPTVTYECTINSSPSGVTIWTGNAFNCTSTQNSLRLFHALFNESSSPEIGSCNDGAIVGWIDKAENNSFISHLNVSVSSDMIGKDIECRHNDNRKKIEIIGKSLIGVEVSHKYLPDSSQNSVYFNWSSLFSTLCPAAHYHINASNCGNCSTFTNYSTTMDNIVCTNVPPKVSICNFSIKFQFCRTIIENATRIPLGQKLESRSVLLPALLGVTASIIITVTLIGVVLFIIYLFCIRMKILKFETFALRSVAVPMTHRGQHPMDQDLHEKDTQCHIYDDKTTLKVFDNKIIETKALKLAGTQSRAQYEDYVPTVGEGELNTERLLAYLRGRVTCQWYKFGAALGVPSNILEKLVKESEKYSEEKALTKVLEYWLKNHPTQPTWQEVANALRDIIWTS